MKINSKPFFTLVFTLFGCAIFGQTPQSILQNSIIEKPKSSFLIMGQLSYDFSGLNHPTDNLNYNGKLIFNRRQEKKLQFPLTLNVGQLKTSNAIILNSRQQIANENYGFGLGFHPEYAIIQYEHKFYLNINAGLTWKFNAFQKKLTNEGIKFMNSGKISASLGFGYNLFKEFSNNRPISLSLTPFTTIFEEGDYFDLFGSNESGFNGLEFSTLIPLGKKNFAI